MNQPTFISRIINNKLQIFSYAIIGGFSAFVDFSIFKTLIDLIGVKYIFSNIISVNFGIFTSYLLNMKFTFKLNDYLSFRFFKFYLVGLIGLAVSTLLLYIFIDFLGLDKIIAKLLIIVFVALLQFTINKLYTFKKLNYE
jgi:putative flippase GtrA